MNVYKYTRTDLIEIARGKRDAILGVSDVTLGRVIRVAKVALSCGR